MLIVISFFFILHFYAGCFHSFTTLLCKGPPAINISIYSSHIVFSMDYGCSTLDKIESRSRQKQHIVSSAFSLIEWSNWSGKQAQASGLCIWQNFVLLLVYKYPYSLSYYLCCLNIKILNFTPCIISIQIIFYLKINIS